MTESRWAVRLSGPAQEDILDIARWTRDHFGLVQARAYRLVIKSAIDELVDGPEVPGSVARNDISPGLRLLHVARHGHRGRHFLLYRVVASRRVEIIRILHDAMDLPRHLP